VLRAVRERGQQRRGRLVDRLDVVDRDHQAPTAGDRQQEIAQRGLDVPALGSPLGGGGSARRAEHVCEQLGARLRAALGEIGKRVAQLRAQRPDDAIVAMRGVGGVGAQHGGAEQLGLQHARVEKARAAAAGRALDQQAQAMAEHGAAELGAHRLHERVAADQRRGDQVRARDLGTLLRQPGDPGEPLHHVRGRARSRGAIELQQLHDQLREPQRQPGDELVQRRWSVAPGVRQVLERARRVRVAAGEHEVGERAERVQICARVERLQLERLGRNEGRRSDHMLDAAHRRHRAEVDQLGAAVAGAAHVARGEVAVEQPARVQDRERGGDVAQEDAGLAPGQLAALAQVLPVEPFHRVKRVAAVDAVVVDLDDARMRELAERVVLALELRGEQRSAARIADAQLLERERRAAARIDHTVDDAAGPAAELRLDPVPPRDEGPDGQRAPSLPTVRTHDHAIEARAGEEKRDSGARAGTASRRTAAWAVRAASPTRARCRPPPRSPAHGYNSLHKPSNAGLGARCPVRSRRSSKAGLGCQGWFFGHPSRAMGECVRDPKTSIVGFMQ
jgi:hypothetical protein